MRRLLLGFFSMSMVMCGLTWPARAVNVGDKLTNLQLLTFKNDKWVKDVIPFLGEKVLTIMYTDVDIADINDPLSDAIKKLNPPVARFQGMGIGDSKDAPWKPDVFIRMAAKRKLKKYPGSVILLDEDLTFPKKMGLGDCDDKSVVMVIDNTGIIRYLRKIGGDKESKDMVPEVIKVIQTLLNPPPPPPVVPTPDVAAPAAAPVPTK